MTQVRPRLTEREIQFLIHSLGHTLAVVDQKEREYKQLQHRVYQFKKEMHYNTMVWRELKQAKEDLSSMGNVDVAAIRYRSVCNSLIRRFEALLKGGKLHTGFFAEHSLRQLNLEPKNLEKTQFI